MLEIGTAKHGLATLGALAALPGAGSQLQSLMQISRNVGLTEPQLQQAAAVFDAAPAGPWAAAR